MKTHIKRNKVRQSYSVASVSGQNVRKNGNIMKLLTPPIVTGCRRYETEECRGSSYIWFGNGGEGGAMTSGCPPCDSVWLAICLTLIWSPGSKCSSLH